MLDLSKVMDAAKRMFGGDNRLRITVIIGIVGMLLVLMSHFFSGDRADKGVAKAEAEAVSTSDYSMELEGRLKSLISSVDGVGKAEVMITFENGGETVYAQEEKKNYDKQQEANPTASSGKTYQKVDVEQKYILVDGANGKQEALVKTQTPPKVQGVVVLCEGAGNIKIDERVIHVVTTALNIPTTRVCVVKISN